MTNELIFVFWEMDPNHPSFPDGLNMLTNDLDFSRHTETQAEPSGSAVTPTSRPKRFTSNVCQCFGIVQMTLPDGTIGPRTKCKFCIKDYCSSRQGTGHLRRHMEKCMPAHGDVDTTTHAQLQRHPDGSVTTWIYDPERARNSLARYIVQTDQPINFGDNIFFFRNLSMMHSTPNFKLFLEPPLGMI
ncbi:hypothetical protein Dsin_001064 [Dipteronia sinensis]|uniref:BED-type domain-containing protein n=1 Tax=Dipteronia sinensis TaxID=43782 RepID=A0AAE0B3A0_9ROSI|nr:hypothetical protein Dsin_001064 [Dipteronia sinensis]